MQLKSLQIQGFKSFPDKTTLLFDRGITAVVGPNGSGKSNIADAVRWVMGEQSTKNLRGEKMEDVIFLGTHDRKATGFALVALTIDNADRQLDFDADEVTISRKLFRSGDSEYRINQSAVRLKDVNEILMDTGLGRDGYSMVGQGKIEEIVSAKSTQRREIFEEAAGISKYRYHKAEAEKRLEDAYENLLRLKDIMAELEDRVEPLQEQAKKAEAFLDLSNEKKTLEVSLWVVTLNRSRTLILEQENQLMVAKNHCSDFQAVLNELQCQLDDAYAQTQECSVTIEDKRHQITEMKTELSQCDADLAVLNNDMAHNRDNMQELQAEILKYTQNKERTLQHIAENQQLISTKESLRQKITQEKETQEEKATQILEELNRSSESLAQLKAKRAAYEQSIAVQKLNKASSSTLIEESLHRLADLKSSGTNRDGNLQATQEEMNHCNDLLHEIDQRLQTLDNTKNSFLIKTEQRQQEAAALILEQDKAKAQIEKKLQKARILMDMERNLEGYYNSVKHIMTAAQQGQLEGICGPVSQLIRTQSIYSVAIETALGTAMQNVVVADEQSAKKAIQNLKLSRSGRATFLPISVIRPQVLNATGIETMESYVGRASDLVSCREEYRNIIENLLGRVAVVENLDAAVLIAKQYGYKFRIVTLDGQIVNAGGSLTGGSTVKNAGLLSRKEEIQTLEQEASTMKEKLHEIAFKLTKQQQESAALTAHLLGIDAELKTTQEDKITYSSELKRLVIQYEDMSKAKEDVLQEYHELQRKLELLQRASVSSNDQISGISSELEQVCIKIDQEKEHFLLLTQSQQTLAESIQNKRFEFLTVSKDLEALQNTTEQLKDVHVEQKQQVQELLEKIHKLQNSTTNFEQDIQAKLERKKCLMENVNKEQIAIESTLQRRSSLEQKLSEIRSRERENIANKEHAAAEVGRFEDKKSALQEEYDRIIAKLWDEYNLTRSQADQVAVRVDDAEKMKLRLTEIKNKIRALGSVNVAAIEEYHEVSERYQFMKKQISDIEQSRTELIRLIRELTLTMRELFTDNFQKINRNFKLVFQELFLGGYGELVLTDSENVLESGIEINVQPPGKIIKNISSLSGGEKAFVAIAIYFAILKVKPSPFCILDEIEAALDEVNVTRYARYLKKLSDKTQFIAITHRRGTMEEADVMYGVTMQEKGVSKLLELDIAQVENQLGIK